MSPFPPMGPFANRRLSMLQLALESVNRVVVANRHEATSSRSPRVYKGCQRRRPELVCLWNSHAENGPVATRRQGKDG